MNRKINIVFACVLAVMLSGVEASFSQINSDSLILVYTKKMQKYLDKEGAWKDYFVFDKEGISVYPSLQAKDSGHVELKISWQEIIHAQKHFYGVPISFSTLYNKTISYRYIPSDIGREWEPFYVPSYTKPLLNQRIALDPGHIAGDIETAKTEKKWVEMKANPAKGIKKDIQLIEGELTLSTAKLLKKKLEDAGAVVMLTRDKTNISAFGIDFKKWKDSLFVSSVDSAYRQGNISFEEKNFLLTKANDTEIFRRFFLQEEMRERARKINEFIPSLTIIIHYNVDETNVNWNKPTKKNFNMAFVGGSFMNDEYEKPESRLEFLRLLLTNELEKSIEFSSVIAGNFEKYLKVPLAENLNDANYLNSSCISAGEKGVYCRNLALTRMVRGILVYGETLYQDNLKECQALNEKYFKVYDGSLTSPRCDDVAEAYYWGVLEYLKNKK